MENKIPLVSASEEVVAYENDLIVMMVRFDDG
jgi:hypothetical protein